MLSFSFLNALQAQDFNGQWKGSFNARGEEGRMEYVVELTVDGTDVTGYSYTYPVFGGKKYFDICEIKGYINKKEKFIEIKEVGKVKSNVPAPYRFDCFQTHKLTYSKGSDVEKLSGPWEPAVLSTTVCGYGTTVLERKKLKDIVTAIKEEEANPVTIKEVPKKPAKAATTPKTTPPVATKPKKSEPVVKNDKPKSTGAEAKPKPKPGNAVVKATPEKKLNEIKDTVAIARKNIAPVFEKIKAKPLQRFESRTNKVLQTIDVEEENISVQLYDNGQIDGDTVTVTFNGDVVALKKGLSAKPIVLNLKVKAGVDNELVMYAENLGSIPPNTALMVVWVDDKRYEVNISSDEKRNGSIIFRREN